MIRKRFGVEALFAVARQFGDRRNGVHWSDSSARAGVPDMNQGRQGDFNPRDSNDSFRCMFLTQCKTTEKWRRAENLGRGQKLWFVLYSTGCSVLPEFTAARNCEGYLTTTRIQFLAVTAPSGTSGSLSTILWTLRKSLFSRVI